MPKKSILIEKVLRLAFVLVAALLLFQCVEEHDEINRSQYNFYDRSVYGRSEFYDGSEVAESTDNRVVLTEIAGDIDWDDRQNIRAEIDKGNLWVEIYVAKVNIPDYFSNGTGGNDHLYFFARGYDLGTGEITSGLISFEISGFELFRGNFYRLLVKTDNAGRGSFDSFSEKYYIYPKNDARKNYVPYIGPEGSVVVLASRKYTDIFAFSNENLTVSLGNDGASAFWDASKGALALPSDLMGSISRNIDLEAETYFASGYDASVSDWTAGKVSPNLPSDVAGADCVERVEGDNNTETTFTMIDSDADGIPDCTEAGGVRAGALHTFFKHPLSQMGAKVNQRDVFVEIDYMDVDDQLVVPNKQALEKAVETFKRTGEHNEGKEIHVHFDVGKLYSETFSPEKFNLIADDVSVADHHNKGGGDKVPLLYGVGIHGRYEYGDSRYTFYEFKERYFDYRKKAFSHYMLMVVTQDDGGELGPGGVAEVDGNDVMISTSWKDSRFTKDYLANEGKVEANLVYNTQASIVIHELGHNLGLQHGGNEDTNYKINYPSVMNYFYSDYGMDADNAKESVRDAIYMKVNLTEKMQQIGIPQLSFFDSDGKLYRSAEDAWRWFKKIMLENEGVDIDNEDVKCLKDIFVTGKNNPELVYWESEMNKDTRITSSKLVFLYGMPQGSFYGEPSATYYDFSRGEMPAVTITDLDEDGEIDFNCDGDTLDKSLNLSALQKEKQGQSEFEQMRGKQISDHNDWNTLAPSFGQAFPQSMMDGYSSSQKIRVQEKPMQRFVDDAAQEIVEEAPRRIFLSPTTRK